MGFLLPNSESILYTHLQMNKGLFIYPFCAGHKNHRWGGGHQQNKLSQIRNAINFSLISHSPHAFKIKQRVYVDQEYNVPFSYEEVQIVHFSHIHIISNTACL